MATSKPEQDNPFAPLNSWSVGLINGALDLVLGPATEEQLRENESIVPGAGVTKRRKRTKKVDDHPVDFALKVRTEAHNIIERQKRKEAIEKEEADKKDASARGNAMQLVSMAVVQMIQIFAVSQATMLTVFIPQKCPAVNASEISSPLFSYNTDLPDGHLCSIKENIDWPNLTKFNQGVLVINAITLIVILSAMGYFWTREVWMVENLQESEELPYGNLVTEFRAYPILEETLQVLNSWAYGFATITFLLYMTNFILSTVFLFGGDEQYNYSLGPRTATSVVTNTMLIMGKVMGYLSYSRLSYKNNWAVSIFSTMPMSFNALDANFK